MCNVLRAVDDGMYHCKDAPEARVHSVVHLYSFSNTDGCAVCPAGTYSHEAYPRKCRSCPFGKYANAGAAVCSVDDVDHESNGECDITVDEPRKEINSPLETLSG